MSLEGQKATQIADERLPKPNGSSFVAICFLTKSFEKIIFGVLKDYAYKDDGEPGERNGSKAVVEAIAGKRPLMYDEYNLCEKAHINQLFFKSNLLREIYKHFEILFGTRTTKSDLLQKITELVVECSCAV